MDQFYSSESFKFGGTPSVHTCVKYSHVGPEPPPPCHVAGCGGGPVDRAGAGANQPGSTKGAREAPQAVSGSGAGRIMAEDNSGTGPISTNLTGGGWWRACVGRCMREQLQVWHIRSEPGISTDSPVLLTLYDIPLRRRLPVRQRLCAAEESLQSL